MSMPIDPNAQAEADADEAKAKLEAQQAAHDQVVADDEEKVAADEAQLQTDEDTPVDPDAPEPTPPPAPAPEPTPAPFEPTPEQPVAPPTPPLPPTPTPDTPPAEPVDTSTLFEFIGADPSSINRAVWVDSGLTDDSGNALYYFVGDPSSAPSDWAEYSGPTQTKNAGTVEEQAARGVTNHGGHVL